MKASTDGIIVTDTSGFIRRVNKAFARLLLCGSSDLVGKHWAELNPLEDKEHRTTYGDKIKGGIYIKGLLAAENFWRSLSGALQTAASNVAYYTYINSANNPRRGKWAPAFGIKIVHNVFLKWGAFKQIAVDL